MRRPMRSSPADLPLWTVAGGVFVVAFLARLVPVLRGAGLDGLLGYDDGVYYAGATALLHGRLPYLDFTLLHPPGVLLVLSPFALVGRLTSDHIGLAVARLGFMTLGAVNAGLVTLVASRTLRPRSRVCLSAAAAGGLFYALWYSSIYATRTDLLEGIGTTCLLTALVLLWRRAAGEPSDGSLWLAGAALAFGACTKIWGVVPLVVIAGWLWTSHGRRAAGRLLLAAALAAVVVCGPFLALAPRQMFRMVVLDQLGRPLSDGSPIRRGLDAMSLAHNLPGLSPTAGALALTIVLAVVLALAVVAWQSGTAGLPVVLLVATSAVLVLGPSYFTHYGELIAAPLALVVAGSVAAWSRSVDGARGWRPATVLPLVAIVLLESPTLTHPLGRPIDTARLRRSVGSATCVATNMPSTLASLDALSRDLATSCPVPVDLTGATYDRFVDVGRYGRGVSRLRNAHWQQYLRRYLMSADAVVVVLPPNQLLDARGLALLRRMPVVARSGPVSVHRVPAACASSRCQ